MEDYRFAADTNSLEGALVGGLNTLLPYNVSSIVAPSALTGDIVHRYWQEQFQIDHGKMDQFITWSDNPGLVMSYYDATPMPEGVLAQRYVMCDNLFHSAFGGSFLNHQYFISGQAPVYPNAATLLPTGVALLDNNGVLQLNPTTPHPGARRQHHADWRGSVFRTPARRLTRTTPSTRFSR